MYHSYQHVEPLLFRPIYLLLLAHARGPAELSHVSLIQQPSSESSNFPSRDPKGRGFFMSGNINSS